MSARLFRPLTGGLSETSIGALTFAKIGRRASAPVPKPNSAPAQARQLRTASVATCAVPIVHLLAPHVGGGTAIDALTMRDAFEGHRVPIQLGIEPTPRSLRMSWPYPIPLRRT